MGNASTYVSNTRAKEQSDQYSQLICMGFDESISLKAATIHPTNINAAITYIASQSSSQTSSANDNNGSKSIDWPLNFPVYITIGHEAHQSGFTLTKEMYLKWKVVDVLRLLIEKMKFPMMENQISLRKYVDRGEGGSKNGQILIT
eukprot:557469_1